MRKKCYIYALAALLPLFSSGQMYKDSTGKKAFDLFSDRKYDSALHYFDLVYRSNDSLRTIALFMMAQIEFWTKRYDAAEPKYKTILNIAGKNDSYMQYESRLNLAEIEISRKQFSTALLHLRDSKKYKGASGYPLQEYDVQYKYSRCFDGIGQIDSAINCISMFMFRMKKYLFYNAENESERSLHYYNLLVKKYGACFVKEELISALDNLHYSNVIDSSGSQNSSGLLKAFNFPLSIRIESYFPFLGNRIWLAKSSWAFQPGNAPESYSREYYINAVKETHLYKLIMQEEAAAPGDIVKKVQGTSAK